MEENNINDILGIESSQSQSNNENNTTRYRYPALRTIAGVYMVLAWIIGIAAVITTFYFLSENKMQIFGLVSLIVGGLLALGLAAISESIKVFLDIEYNTRRALMSATLEKEGKENKEIEKNTGDSALEKEIEKELSFSEKVEKLNSLIKSQKGKLFGRGRNKSQIIEITTELCVSKKNAEDLLLYYKRNFNQDLLNELKSLTTSYSGIKEYLSPFIGLGIVKEEYPHDKI